MTFQEWLPMTRRNRVALCLALASLAMFVMWNCMQSYDPSDGSPTGTLAGHLWPELFSPSLYLDLSRFPEMEGFLLLAASLGIILGGLVVMLAVPFWQILHASNYIRLPLAVMSLLGGVILTGLIVDATDTNSKASGSFPLTVMALGMFCLSAAFFTFISELAFRASRARSKAK